VVDLRKIWDERASDWLAWARTPGHDSYWYYSAGFFDDIVPSPPAKVLEVGCGEGRVARDLASHNHSVVAMDSSRFLANEAREADPKSAYLVGDGTLLPFRDARFDIVVSYNSLQDVDDMPAAVGEAARVLRDSGRFCVCIVHPIRDAGSFASEAGDAPFSISDSYFEARTYEESIERDGLQMTFTSWRYSLEQYARALEDAGFLIERVREPLPDHAFTDRRQDRSQRVPMFLFIRAVKSV
jgi:ubiquinone/menaquinone biosynthesis C-methylase UbiE